MLQSKERKGNGKKGKGGKERKGSEEREGKEGKDTGRKVKRKEKKGTTAIWSDIVRNIGCKCYPALGDWGRTSVRQRFGQKLCANWLEMLPCPRIWNIWCCFSETCMILVDRVATKSMDSRGEWGRTWVRQRSGQKLYANWLEMLPCLRIWNIW